MPMTMAASPVRAPTLASLDAYQARVPERSAVDARGGRWSWREQGPADGAGVPLLLLPGAAGTGDVAWKLAEAFASHRRVVSVTYPSGATPEALSDGLAELLDRLGLARAAIWTSSYAAWWIQAFARAHGDRLAGLWLGNGFVDGQAVASLPLFNRAWLESTPADGVRLA